LAELLQIVGDDKSRHAIETDARQRQPGLARHRGLTHHQYDLTVARNEKARPRCKHGAAKTDVEAAGKMTSTKQRCVPRVQHDRTGGGCLLEFASSEWAERR